MFTDALCSPAVRSKRLIGFLRLVYPTAKCLQHRVVMHLLHATAAGANLSSHNPQDMQRPLYMRPKDAIEYGVIDRLVPPQKEMEIIDQVGAPPASDHKLWCCFVSMLFAHASCHHLTVLLRPCRGIALCSPLALPSVNIISTRTMPMLAHLCFFIGLECCVVTCHVDQLSALGCNR